MSHRLRLLVLGLLVLAIGASLPARADTGQVFAHLFAVPAEAPGDGNGSQRITALEAWLTDTFGGFTRLGRGLGGWKNETGQVETEANTLYLATAPRDFSKEIAVRLEHDFGVRVPYVLVFPAEIFVKRAQ